MSSIAALVPGTPLIFVPQSDNIFSITVVRGSDGSTPVTDATGTATLYDEFGQAVPGATSISLSTAGGGVYTGNIANSGFNPSPGRNYRIKVALTSSALSAKRTFWFDAWVAEENIA
jgi:hypothetical protein